MMAILLHRVFELKPDFDVTVVEDDFEDLRERCDWESLDAALIDQYLVGIRGSDVFDWLSYAFPHVRRILFTGDERVTHSDSHAHRVIYKPAPPDQLVAAVRSE